MCAHPPRNETKALPFEEESKQIAYGRRTGICDLDGIFRSDARFGLILAGSRPLTQARSYCQTGADVTFSLPWLLWVALLGAS